MVGSGRFRAWLFVPLALALSCGGQSERRAGDPEAGAGGSSGSGVGGTITGGTTAYGCYYGGEYHDPGVPFLTPDGCNECFCTEGGGYVCQGRVCTGSCVYGDVIYDDGTSFRSLDGCNTCVCTDGAVGCTTMDCPIGCTADGMTYAHGETFTFDEPNGCGTCTCFDGIVSCSTMPCPRPVVCDMVSFWYAERALLGGRACDPNLDIPQCNVAMPSSLPCGCPTYLNEDASLRSWMGEFERNGCGNNIVCEPCPMAPIGGQCSEDRVCVDIY